MKKSFTIAFVISMIAQVCIAQTIYNPTVFVSPTGLSTGTGQGSFQNAITASHFMENIYDTIYGGDVRVNFAAGDYYEDFKFWGIPTTIQSIRMYGGFNPRSRNTSLVYRDLENYETRFHAVNEHMVWFEGIGYYNPNSWNTCIIDGITLTSDYHYVDFAAMALVGGDHIISQCKFEGFYSTDLLIWLETGGNTVTFVNCLFDNNKVKNLMALGTHANIINVTIADNDFTDDMFIPFCTYDQFAQTFSTYYYYNLYNSIIYGNSNMNMNHDLTSVIHIGYFDVYNSILEDNEGWINNMANNLIGSTYNPIFNTYSATPYSCDYYSSPAIAAGDASFITLSPYYSIEPDIMDYDLLNNDRYWDMSRSTVDIGAYQNGYDDGYINYNSVTPARAKRRMSDNKSDAISIWANGHTLYIEGIQEEMANLNVYTLMGQSVYTTALQSGLNVIPIPLNQGIYVVRISSDIGENVISKTISIQ